MPRGGVSFELSRDGSLDVLRAFNGNDEACPTTLVENQFGTLFGGAL